MTQLLFSLCLFCNAQYYLRAQLLREHIDLFFHDVTITDAGDSWRIEADGVPNDVDPSTLERLPNAASVQSHSYRFYKTPDFSHGSSCTPLGPIGFALNGVPFFNALTIEGCDAVVYESFDDCEGHSTDTGSYHYHQLSSCVPDDDEPETPLKLHGVALDGVLIYGPLDANGTYITNERLDAHHGSSSILPSGDYAYFMNDEYPYIIGDFRGTTQYTGRTMCLSLLEDHATCSRSMYDPNRTHPPMQGPTTTVSATADRMHPGISQFARDVTLIEGSDSWTIVSDGIPDGEDASSLAANPHAATVQTHRYSFYKRPVLDRRSTCTPVGIIGFALNGVPFFNALTDSGCDAVRYETVDDCKGHATEDGVYHYHQLSPCVHDGAEETPLKIHGVALDGIWIYGPLDADGNYITNDRLDEYHGSSTILPSGQYAYFINNEYPYIIGQFKGHVQTQLIGECPQLVDGEVCSETSANVPQASSNDSPTLLASHNIVLVLTFIVINSTH